MGAGALTEGGLIFGHRAAFASFARASLCLAGPQPLKVAQPKDCDLSIAETIVRIETIVALLYRGSNFERIGEPVLFVDCNFSLFRFLLSSK